MPPAAPTTTSNSRSCRPCRSSTSPTPGSASTRSKPASDSSTATSSPPPPPGERGPLLVAHAHANWVLSEIKLAVDGATGDEPVTILQALGTPDERIVTTTWAELDRTIEADHLTSLYIPELAAPVGAEYVRFHQLARTLREQCPWDIEQTHESLVPYLLEETYEVVDALQALDPDDPTTDEHLIEELGDLLYQIEFHATIAEQEGRFTIADVAAGIHDKLVRRHPHVFGRDGERVEATGTEPTSVGTVLANWDDIKREEKQRTSVFDGIPRSMPSLAYAAKVGAKASKVGFDWPDVDGAFPKVVEETGELRTTIDDGDPTAQHDELGDLLFASSTWRAIWTSIRNWRCAPRPTSSGPASKVSNGWRPNAASTCAPPSSPPSTRCGTRSRPARSRPRRRRAEHGGSAAISGTGEEMFTASRCGAPDWSTCGSRSPTRPHTRSWPGCPSASDSKTGTSTGCTGCSGSTVTSCG